MDRGFGLKQLAAEVDRESVRGNATCCICLQLPYVVEDLEEPPIKRPVSEPHSLRG
jgi:hypothetical protein